MHNLILPYSKLKITDIPIVGGKNASLGEMINKLSSVGIRTPDGFATTVYAYEEFLKQNSLDQKIFKTLDDLDINDINALQETGKKIRNWVRQTQFPENLLQEIRTFYQDMMKDGEYSVAVRSSATAEDLPDASFAGQQETYLNVDGINNVLRAIKDVFASLYNDRAIAYREHHGFDHREVSLSAGVQKMIRSDIGASGVMFSVDTESGFNDVVFITGAYGLGETVVQGSVNPDEFYVSKKLLANDKPAIIKRNLGSKKIKMLFSQDDNAENPVEIVSVKEDMQHKFCVHDEHIQELAKFAVIIENHYQKPMDIEWALDGIDGKLYIVQARPETVVSREDASSLEQYKMTGTGNVIITGRSIGQKIGSGVAKVIKSLDNMDEINPGDILVTDMTDPDWEPVMKRTAGIITNRGGRTCHAAIIARELGVPAVVGCGNATKVVKSGQMVTVSCAEGDIGKVYEDKIDYEIERHDVGQLPEIKSKIMLNVGNPNRAFSYASIPNKGVGLARLEFIINNMIGIHPQALINFNDQTEEIKKEINKRSAAYDSPLDFYVHKIIEGISTLAVSFYNKPVIVRLSDFKSNEYSSLLGGAKYEPHEENPMLGFRGNTRYLSKQFKPCFQLECQALKYVRDVMGLTNVEIMVPFVRTVKGAKDVINLLAENGLVRGENGLRIIMMCEIPANAILAEDFLQYFDGFSIGSNDLTQLTMGLDRDSGLIAHLFDETNPAIKRLIKMAIKACKKQNKYIGICGQGPSDSPKFAKWLYKKEISSISLNPDTVVSTWQQLSKIADEIK